MIEVFSMGLFDRFKKRVNEPLIKNEITADEDSKEAILAIAQREKNLAKIKNNKHKNLENEIETHTPAEEELSLIHI